jgi:hypothetical protein
VVGGAGLVKDDAPLVNNGHLVVIRSGEQPMATPSREFGLAKPLLEPLPPETSSLAQHPQSTFALLLPTLFSSITVSFLVFCYYRLATPTKQRRAAQYLQSIEEGI